MTFEWDPTKAVSNRTKHGVRFEEAITAFDDPMALRASDQKHSKIELRQWLIGGTDSGRIVVVIFVERRYGSVYRIIGARLASRRERRLYEESKRVSV